METGLELYVDAVVSGIPLVFVVFGFVQLLKLFKNSNGEQTISGNALLAFSFGMGLVLGVGYMVFSTHPPTEGGSYEQFRYWFGNVIYGFGLGLLASAFWEALRALAQSALEKFFFKLAQTQTQILVAPDFEGRSTGVVVSAEQTYAEDSEEQNFGDFSSSDSRYQDDTSAK